MYGIFKRRQHKGPTTTRAVGPPCKTTPSSQNYMGTPKSLPHCALRPHNLKRTVTYFRLCYVLAHSTVNRNSILQAQRTYPEPLIRNVFLNQGAVEELSSLEAFRDVEQMGFTQRPPRTEDSSQTGIKVVPDLLQISRSLNNYQRAICGRFHCGCEDS